MSPIRHWLDSLNLGQYADAFEGNAIKPDQISTLTDNELKELGVAAVGHRKRIRDNATSLCAPIPDAGGHQTVALATPPTSASEAERRQLTVMFCDLVGSTRLSGQMDPEAYREVLSTYQDTVKVTIERYGGYVARYMGDGVLAYFGYPQAHEDDAERATRAGLELVDSVPKLETPISLAVRVGIATGPVIVGDLIGESSSQERAVVGETPNLAARLQGEGDANAVLIAETTHSLVRGVFEFQKLGERALKGFAKAQPLWGVVGERQTKSRFEALRSETLGRFVGRRSEVALLLERWESALGGEGQVVLLRGESLKRSD